MRTCSHKLPRRRTRSGWRSWGGSLGAIVLAATLAGCAAKPPPPFVPLRQDGAKIAHCFDGVPHQSGAKPWVLGGPCCCTPTPEMLVLWQRDGYFTAMSVDEVIALYDEKGVKTALDHRFCNNQCQYGPHVTKGGHCLAPPTPGTRNYEEIITGRIAGQTAATEPIAAAGGD